MQHEEMAERVAELRRLRDTVSGDFALSELTVGTTNCRIARSRAGLGLGTTLRLNHAKRSLHRAERFMWKLKYRGYDFNQMTAQAERLRMEIESLKGEKD